MPTFRPVRGVLAAVVLAVLVASVCTTSTVGATIGPDPDPPPSLDIPVNANFRTFCEFSHAAYDDPIVHPDDPGAAHLHFFFGNTRTNAFSTPESLVNSGQSTCQGNTFNRSAYWMPAVFTAEGAPILPDRHDVYYKHLTEEPPEEVQPLPEGLMMIAGDASGAPEDYLQIAYWRCTSWPFDAAHPNSDTIPTCAVGDEMRMALNFPSCWDGTDLDSADHQSHMSYVEYNAEVGAEICPPSHPVIVPQLSLHFEWEVRDTPSQGWYLSSDRHGSMSMPGGSTLHADWMNGWDPEIQEAWVTSCINEQRDCANGTLGDGRILDMLMPLGSARIPRPRGSFGPHCNGRPATIVGTSQSDTIQGTPGDDVIVAFGGDDEINGLGGFDIICSGSGNDVIDGGDGDDEIWAGSGNDVIVGGEGDDLVKGSAGSDTIIEGPGLDYLFGGRGNDDISGGDNHNFLHGGSGDDRLTGGYWEDAIMGGSGDDIIDGIGGLDRVWGGPGTDQCSADGRVWSCE